MLLHKSIFYPNQRGLRAFLLLIFSVIVLATSWAVAEEPPDEFNLIKTIEKMDGKVKRFDSLPGRPMVMLNLEESDYSDFLLRKLTPSISLEYLKFAYLRNSRLEDAGFAKLGPAKNLVKLDVFNTGITDEGLKALSELEKLTDLNVGCTGVTDAGLNDLRKLTSLITLDLSSNPITDLGLKEVSEFENLTSLNLSGAEITDAGIAELNRLKKLTKLILIGTKITSSGMKQLTNPNCRIYINSGDSNAAQFVVIGRKAQEIDIQEAVFRWQFDHNGSGLQKASKVFFLSIGGRDLSDEFMKRFASNQPPVKNNSDCRIGEHSEVFDKITGGQGLEFYLMRHILWKSETEVEIRGGYHEGNMSASDNTYTLRKENDKWTVINDRLDGQS